MADKKLPLPEDLRRHRAPVVSGVHGRSRTRKWMRRAIMYSVLVEREGIDSAEAYRRSFQNQYMMTRALRGEI